MLEETSGDKNSLPGVILLAHGSPDPEAAQETHELRDALSALRPDWRFDVAFLNHEPKLDHAVESLMTMGCTHIRILPLLVFKGKHLREDIPALVSTLRSRLPKLPLELQPHLSQLPGFREILLRTLENS